MVTYTRVLKYQLPLIMGEDVIALQKRIRELKLSSLVMDGIFGANTERAVCRFQEDNDLMVDGVVGPLTWNRIFGEQSKNDYKQRFIELLPDLMISHDYRASVNWQVTNKGVSVEEKPPQYTKGNPITIERLWRDLRAPLLRWSENYGVPVELILATICTESGGNLDIKARLEPGYVSDEETPHRVSPGIMQTLISTARDVLGSDKEVNRAWLELPENSIHAGTAYIASQWKKSHFDPPKVACAYNAGGVYFNDSVNNRWKMRQYPIGSDDHADRFVLWFNDCFRVLDPDDKSLNISFVAQL